MRSTTPLLAAGLALAVASQALAQGAGAPTSPGGGAASPPMTSQPPASPSDANPSPSSKPSTPSTSTPSTSAQPDQSAAPSANGSSAPASATAPGGAAQAAPSFTVGETVKDNTGASIGTISSLTGAGASQMAVIKMGDQSFQVQASKLGSADGAAEINMTKAQIAGMLKK